jgi:hypothetical protein
MIDEKRLETTPAQHVCNLIESIKNGKLTVTYYDPIDPPLDRTYDVSCTKTATDEILVKYEELTKALHAIGAVREKLDNGIRAEEILTAEQLEVWNTYVRDFDEKFDAGEYDIDIIYDMRECGAPLSDEEQDVLERHYEWFKAQSITRLPSKTRSPMYLINRAQRYEYFVRMNAPEIVIAEEGRCLAEEMILYYYCV